MDNQNSGQFMAPAGGGGDALQAAIARRSGALNQQGQGSATPSVLPSAPPQGNPQMVSATPQSSAAPSNERTDDAHIILKAMSQRLKSQEKIAEAMSIPPKIPMGGA